MELESKNKRGRGRPVGYRAENPMSETLPRVRITPAQQDAYQAAAKKRGMKVSQWVRDVLDKAVG